MIIQDFVTRVASGVDRAGFLKQVPGFVLVEIDGTAGQDAMGAPGEVAITARLTSANIRHQSVASRQARVLELPGAAGPVLVGRTRACGVLIEHASVSKEHARFHVGPKGLLELEDLDSTNGTWVNGVRLEPHKKATMQTDSAVRFGRGSVYHLLDPGGFFDYLGLLQRFGL